MVGGIEPVPLEEELAAATAVKQGVIFVLENAQLEVAKVGKNYELLNCDDHANFLRRHNKDPALYRPDICHQVCAVVWDVPNVAGSQLGRLRLVWPCSPTTA